MAIAKCHDLKAIMATSCMQVHDTTTFRSSQELNKPGKQGRQTGV